MISKNIIHLINYKNISKLHDCIHGHLELVYNLKIMEPVLRAHCIHHIFSHIVPSVPSDSGLRKKTCTPYEAERSKTQAENQARMMEIFKEAHISKGLPMANIEEEVRRYVYGAPQTVTNPTKKSKLTEEKDTHPDPTYEPDADEMATADDDLGTDEEELNADNPKTKVVISSFL